MTTKFNLGGRSATELRGISSLAAELAADLAKAEPSTALALEHGIVDKSYNTIREGRVSRYEGEAIITMEDGRRWKAIGHGPRGCAEYVSRHGFIEFIPLDLD